MKWPSGFGEHDALLKLTRMGSVPPTVKNLLVGQVWIIASLCAVSNVEPCSGHIMVAHDLGPCQGHGRAVHRQAIELGRRMVLGGIHPDVVLAPGQQVGA